MSLLVLQFLLNLPWTIAGFVLALFSIPSRMAFQEGTFVINVRSFWWSRAFPWMKGVRGMTSGSMVLLSANREPRDLEHELVHVRQYGRYPFVFPFMYAWELVTRGFFPDNRFEKEAYTVAGNVYHGG